MTEWLALMLYIQEVLGSNFGLQIGYPDRWFPSVLPGKCKDSALNYAVTASIHILSNYSLIILSFNGI
jgi:hypothetical protein